MKICKAISEGTPRNEIVKEFGISKSSLQVIINKESHVDISDKYFTRDGYTITSKLTGKKYNLTPPHGGRARITSAAITTTTTTAKTSTTSNLVSEIRDLGLQILMNTKINDLPDDIKSQVKEIIENTIDSMSLRDISKLGG